jgi:acyl carrier protein phosphodiesterase
MNFLAHLYLSGNSGDIMTGNFIGDYIKGNRFLAYRDGIRRGILIHRKIDHYTDHHKAFLETKNYFRPVYNRYSGIAADVVFDYFLANKWHLFSEISLSEFASYAHSALLKNFDILPDEVKRFLPIMIHNRRLESYATTEGIDTSLRIMSGYSSIPYRESFIPELLSSLHDQLFHLFNQFMDDIIYFINESENLAIVRPVDQ